MLYLIITIPFAFLFYIFYQMNKISNKLPDKDYWKRLETKLNRGPKR